jgi:hypothetical protein
VPSEDQKIVLGLVLLLAAVVYQLIQRHATQTRPEASRSKGERRETPSPKGE